MSRFVVTADAMGVPTVEVPLPLVWDLAQCFHAEEITVAYDHANNHVQVNFPGWDALTVQNILDGASVPGASATEGFASWPGLHSAGHVSEDVFADRPETPAAMGNQKFNAAPSARTTLFLDPNSSTSDSSASEKLTIGRALADMRAVMEDMTPAQQNRLTELVCGLQATLAAERLCFHKLFEAAPDGYVATDLDGNIQHANAAMHQLLQVPPPALKGKLLPTLFTPGSRILLRQRMRLLRLDTAEIQSCPDFQAHIVASGERRIPVSVRMIGIASEDPGLSTLRWLIRDTSVPGLPVKYSPSCERSAS